ncbi:MULTISPECIES: alkene reductase [Cupriavidus]|jgi:N-ethylmaleimide reductase|uniref:Alkene reductase n=1 Tax=Cupriavidus pauculus TaxID=82633 RepID=A0A5P2H4A5_9BURK|nr:alkene reductase [Cupriavidus pauculus]QET02169.1 alkene reductase [Cupriavidus pauculus]
MPDKEAGPLYKLFKPIKVGPYKLPHRVVMGPLTRSRALRPGNIPSQLNACYYAQRATAALIVSEATQVSMQGQGYAWTPGIHSPAQVEGWRLVADAVHEAQGLMFMQLWHVGRISHPSLQPDEMLPVAPCALQPKAEAFIENERGEGVIAPCVKPRALQPEEMPYVVRQYFRGARNAKAAGMDGVEVHGANGYLLDQFLLSGTNSRADEYGGSIERRARLLLEVVETVCEVWGPDRVGVRLSPLGTFNDMHDDDPEATFSYVVEKLNRYGLAYLHIVNPALASTGEDVAAIERAKRMSQMIRRTYRGVLMVAGGFDGRDAEKWIEDGNADLIAFGRLFIANPDLPERLRLHAALNSPDPTTFYGGGERGYTDYPTLAQERGESPRSVTDGRWR